MQILHLSNYRKIITRLPNHERVNVVLNITVPGSESLKEFATQNGTRKVSTSISPRFAQL